MTHTSGVTVRTSLRTAGLAFGLVALMIGILSSPLFAEQLRIMPVGDSITRGLNWGGAEPGGYRTRLYNRLDDELFAEQGVSFVGTQDDNPDPDNLPDPFHEGRGGWRIDQHFATIEFAISLYSPALVLLHLGTNDIDQEFELSTAPERLDTLIGQILSVSPYTYVLVAQIIDSTVSTRSSQIQVFNSALPSIVNNRQAAGERVFLANLFHSVSNPTNYWTNGSVVDTYHPNKAGYDELADGWFETIVQLNATVGGLSNPPSILPGDFDIDSEVDGEDFLIWQRGLSPSPFSRTDLEDWQNYYGGTAPFTDHSFSVPEPSFRSLTALVVFGSMFIVRGASRMLLSS